MTEFSEKFECPRSVELNTCVGCDDIAYQSAEAVFIRRGKMQEDAEALALKIKARVSAILQADIPIDRVGDFNPDTPVAPDNVLISCEQRRMIASRSGERFAQQEELTD